MTTLSFVTLLRTATLAMAAVLFLAAAGPASATKQRRATDGNAANSVALCEAFGGSATVDVEGFQLEIDGHAGPNRTSTTTCDGGLLDGMSCGNYEGGGASCSASRLTEQPGATVGGIVAIDSTEAIEVETEQSGDEAPESVEVSSVESETVDAKPAVEEAAEEEAAPADETTEPVVTDPTIDSQATAGASDASGAVGGADVQPVAGETVDVGSSGEVILVEATEDEVP